MFFSRLQNKTKKWHAISWPIFSHIFFWTFLWNKLRRKALLLKCWILVYSFQSMYACVRVCARVVHVSVYQWDAIFSIAFRRRYSISVLMTDKENLYSEYSDDCNGYQEKRKNKEKKMQRCISFKYKMHKCTYI